MIATVPHKNNARSTVEAGARHVLVRDETEELGSAIRDLTGGDGVDVVFDQTGKALFEVSISVLRQQGVLVRYDSAGRSIPLLSSWNRQDDVHRAHCRGDTPHKSIDQWRRHAAQVMQWIDDGTLHLLIDRTYPLEDAATAHRELESQEPHFADALTPEQFDALADVLSVLHRHAQSDARKRRP